MSRLPPSLMAAAVLSLLPVLAPGADAARAPAAIPEDYYYSFLPLASVAESAANPITVEKVALGRILFFDPRLSKNHDVSCNSCHELTTWGVDGRRVSLGHRDQTGTRNSPSVYNAAFHVAQFWDGRSPDVEDQSKQPILNPVEMAMPDQERAVATLRSMPDYVALFARAFPNHEPSLSYDTLALAIGAFERGLVTPTGFDDFLRGDVTALSDEQRHGCERFVALGCASCHNGPAVGGHAFELLGLIEAWPDRTDQGVYEVSGDAADRMLFKVPSLRNVSRTPPYFHDGSIPDLEEAVRSMARHQLGHELAPADVEATLSFLDSLASDSLPFDYIARPELPEATDATPPPIPE